MSDRLVELLTDAVEAGRTAATNLGKSDLWPHLDRIDSILEHVSQHELRSANFTRELELAVVSVLAQQMYLLRYDFWGVFKDKQVHWGIMEVPLQVALEKLNRFHLLTRLEADLAQKRLKTEVESITFPPFDLKTKFENLDNFLAQIAKLKSSFAAVYNSSQTFGTLQAALSTFRDRMSGKSPSLAGDDATAKLFKDLYTLRKIQSYTRLAILENKTRPFSTSVHGLPRFASNDEYKPVLPYILEAREESIAKYAAHRILQATGEYLKATDQTPHLTKDTQAQITTSHKVPVDQITKLRDHLSHCNSFVALRQRRKLEWVDKSTRQLQKSLQRVAGAIDSFCSALELQSIKMLTSEAAVYCPGLRFDASEAEWMTRSLPTFAQIRDAKESCRRKVQELRQQLRDVLQGGDETAPAPVWDLYSHLEYLEWAQHTSICCFHINPDKIPTPAVIHERLEGGERPDDYGTRIKLYHEYSFKGMLPDHTKEAEADAPDSSRWTTAELEDLFDPFVECLLGDFMTPETFSKLRGFYPSWKFEETEIPGVASEIVRRMRFVGCGQDFGHRIELFVYLSCLRAASEPKRGGLDGSVPVQYAHLLRCIGGQDPGWSSLKLPLHNTGTENGREDYTRILRTTSEKLRDGVSVEEVIQAKLSQIVERLEAEDDREKVATLINDKRREFEEKRAEIDRLKAANTGANVRRHEERLRQLDYVKLLNSEKQRTFHGRARILDKVLAPLPTDLLLACREKYREIELESLRLHLQHRVEALRAIWPKADEEVIEDLIWSDIRYCQDFVEAVAFLALDITTTLKEFGDTAGNKQLGDAPSLASKSVRARGPYTNPVLVEAALFAALPVRNFLAHGDMLVEAMIPHLNSVAILNLAAGLLRNSNAILSLLDLFLAKNQSMLKHLEAMLHAGNLTTLTPDSLPGELRTERNARLIVDLQGEDWLNLVQGVLRQQQHKTSKCDLLRAELDRHKFQAHLKSLRPAEPNCGPCAEFDDLGMTTLHHAVLRGDLDGVAALLPLGNAALVNSQECKNGKKSGLSPLHIAAAKGNCEIVSKLVELGADLNSVGSNLYSPRCTASPTWSRSCWRKVRPGASR